MNTKVFLYSFNNSRMKAFILLLLFSLFFSTNCFSRPASDAELLKKINAIEKKSNVIMGISAIHIEKNKTIAHNSKQRFFMASTIKLPIALAFLNRVDEKKESLERIIKLDLSNSVPGSGSLYYACEKKKTSMSLHQILKYMMANSDNSASDTILHTVSPEYVTKRMNELGFKNIQINRSILEMFMDTNHVDHKLLKEPRTVYSWKKIFNSIPLKQKMLAWQRFEKDPRDTTTPDDMAKLLVKLQKNQVLSEASTKVILKIMEQCRTGRSRIRGLLPANVKVAHKTGTWAIGEQNYLSYPGSKNLFRFASDVGIITLPNNKGHIAIAVYVKSQAASDYSRTRAIALASRAVYDHFMKL
ncbi:class A beta-lactamase [uncultured Legionella sp.]|uniref:class A beta-lactamase n=1 Tax=uncultured Legionella sp. TaxID=210934 RepID=UPI002606A6D6|nr:class A beta-lactamase [uncultured Legionella sp.]